MLQTFKDKFAKSLFNMTVDEAVERRICIKCQSPVEYNSWDSLDIDEYLITGLCPDCYCAITKDDE